MKKIHTKAIILNRINFGEADRILTLLTPDQGKLSVLAKGVRRSKSKLAGGLELFSVSNITFIDGRSDLKTVISTQLQNHYRGMVKNIDATMTGYEILKMINTNTQGSCESGYFELLFEVFESLDRLDSTDSTDMVYAWFCARLLGLSGIGINLELQNDGKIFDELNMYSFNYDDMGFYSHDSGEYSPKHIKFLRLLSKVSSPDNLIKVSDAQKLAKDLRPLLAQCISYQ